MSAVSHRRPRADLSAFTTWQAAGLYLRSISPQGGQNDILPVGTPSPDPCSDLCEYLSGGVRRRTYRRHEQGLSLTGVSSWPQISRQEINVAVCPRMSDFSPANTLLLLIDRQQMATLQRRHGIFFEDMSVRKHATWFHALAGFYAWLY